MIIFTYKLEKIVKKNILPRILLVPNNYSIKGSFKRKVPYITHIHIVNNVCSIINKNDIYDNIVNLINRLTKYQSQNIIILYVKCGTDPRFYISDDSKHPLQYLKNMVTAHDAHRIELIEESFKYDEKQKNYLINGLLKQYYKIHWTLEEIILNKKILPGGIKITFNDVINSESMMLLKYIVKLENIPIAIDVTIKYESCTLPLGLVSSNHIINNPTKLVNYSGKYYNMLCSLKQFFKNNPVISKEIEYLIKMKFGLYQQLTSIINTYDHLYHGGKLNIRFATDIVISIIKDIEYIHIPGINYEIIKKIKDVAINNPPNLKIYKWYVLLDELYENLDSIMNTMAKDDCYKYVNMIPEEHKNQWDKYYLDSL